jgi:hypothetical protein
MAREKVLESAAGDGGRLPVLRELPEETHELLADRERLARVRLARWSALLGTFQVRQDVLGWARRMAALNGPRVQVWENTVGWVMALYIARYGENEAYWPETLTDEDWQRAQQWERDDTLRPRGVRYIPHAPEGGLP